jgi:hypothetical protein
MDGVIRDKHSARLWPIMPVYPNLPPKQCRRVPMDGYGVLGMSWTSRVHERGRRPQEGELCNAEEL